MLKTFLCLNLLFFVAQTKGKVLKRGPLEDNTIDDENKEWKNLWFPHPPNYQNTKNVIKNANNVAKIEPLLMDNKKGSEEKFQGLWFPHPPGYKGESDVNNENNDMAKMVKKNGPPSDNMGGNTWKGLWFPHEPKNNGENKSSKTLSRGHHFEDFLDDHECDNGMSNIGIDFDPENKRHSYNYLCLGNRTEYQPNLDTTALLMEHFVPAAYQPPVRCLSDKITYDESLPTFGAYRPLPPKYGSYKYLPPQRWLRSLADGAIVLLYHPCAFPGQIKELQNTLEGCLYRHIITPSQLLTPQRPLALLAWGKCLQMSVVDEKRVVDFIKTNAKLGFQQPKHSSTPTLNFYEAGLINEAHLVTDEQDSEICGYKEM